MINNCFDIATSLRLTGFPPDIYKSLHTNPPKHNVFVSFPIIKVLPLLFINYLIFRFILRKIPKGPNSQTRPPNILINDNRNLPLP